MNKKTIAILSFLVLFFGTCLPVSAQTNKADDIVGTWLNQEATGKVTIYKENGKYFGKLVWLRNPIDSITGKPRTDKLNPDPKLQSNQLIGLINLKNFTFNGKDEWSGGTIYDPKNGKTYSCKINFENNGKLKIRGYVGVSMLGRNTYWTKSIAPQQ